MTEPTPSAASLAPRPNVLPEVLKGAAILFAILLLVHVSRMVLTGEGNVTVPDAFAYQDAALSLRSGEDMYLRNKIAADLAATHRKATPEEAALMRGKPYIYIYPPAFAALFAPLTALDEETGMLVWWVLHFAFIGWLAFALIKLCRIRGLGRSMDVGLILCVGLYGALSAEFRWGQVNLLVLALVATGLWLIEEKKDIPGALLIALAAHIKILPGALLILLVMQRRNRAAVWMVAGLVGFLLLPAPWLIATKGVKAIGEAVSLNVDYAKSVVLPALTSGRTSGIPQFYTSNNSLHAVFNRLFGEETILYSTRARIETVGPLLFALPKAVIAALSWGGALGLFGGSLWFGWRQRNDRLGRAAAAGLLLVALQFANVLFWEHHVVTLILPLAALIGWNARKVNWALWLTVPIALVLSLPAAINDLLVLQDSDQDRVLFPRLWGLPTLAILAVWAGTVVLQLRAARASKRSELPESSRPVASAPGS